MERCVHQLRSGAVDVAFGFEQAFTEWSDLKLTQVGVISAVLYVRRGHPILHGSPVSRAELATYDCVMPSDSRPFGNILRALFESEGVAWQRHLYVTDHQMIARRMVARSNAFALTSAEVAVSEGFGELFECVPVEGLFEPFPISCATRARWELSRPVKAFLQTMTSVPPGGYDLA